MDLMDDDTWDWIADICPEEARFAFGDVMQGSYYLDDIYDELLLEMDLSGLGRYADEEDLRSCIRRTFIVKFCEED